MNILINVSDNGGWANFKQGVVNTSDNCPVEIVEKLLNIVGKIDESTAQPKTEYELYRYSQGDNDVKVYYQGVWQGYITAGDFQKINNTETNGKFVLPDSVRDEDASHVVAALNAGARVQPASANPYY